MVSRKGAATSLSPGNTSRRPRNEAATGRFIRTTEKGEPAYTACSPRSARAAPSEVLERQREDERRRARCRRTGDGQGIREEGTVTGVDPCVATRDGGDDVDRRRVAQRLVACRCALVARSTAAGAHRGGELELGPPRGGNVELCGDPACGTGRYRVAQPGRGIRIAR